MTVASENKVGPPYWVRVRHSGVFVLIWQTNFKTLVAMFQKAFHWAHGVAEAAFKSVLNLQRPPKTGQDQSNNHHSHHNKLSCWNAILQPLSLLKSDKLRVFCRCNGHISHQYSSRWSYRKYAKHVQPPRGPFQMDFVARYNEFNDCLWRCSRLMTLG